MALPILTLTGVDHKTDTQWMKDAVRSFILKTGYSGLEFGILRSPKAGQFPRFPDRAAVKRLLAATGKSGDYAFHLCGEYARMVEEERWSALCDIIDFEQVGRVQVNLPDTATDVAFDARVLLLWRFSVYIGRPVIMQVRGNVFPAVPSGVHLLQDRSGGTGKLPSSWAVKSDAAIKAKTPCGFAGGLCPTNVEWQIGKMRPAVANTVMWVDCESSVRTNDVFDTKLADAMMQSVRSAFADRMMEETKVD